MLSFRLDFDDGDFKLIFPPALILHQEIRAYHLELLSEVRKYPYFEAPASDKILFDHYRKYYEKIAYYFDIEAKNLTSKSRHEFFISHVLEGDYSISGLEELMGYSFGSGATEKQVQITTGSSELDVLAEILLIIPEQALQIASHFSLAESLLIAKQMSDRQNSEEALKELQRKKDLDSFKNKDVETILKKTGFNFPE